MDDKKRGKEESGDDMSSMAVTREGKKVVKELQYITEEFVDDFGAFKMASLWHRLAERTNELIQIIQQTDVGEQIVSGMLEYHDQDEEEVKLFPVEMKFLVRTALSFSREIQLTVCKNLGKTPDDINRIMSTEALANGSDAEFVREFINKMLNDE